VRWTKEEFGAGSLTLTGDKVLILTEKGELTMIEASPEGFKETGRRQITGFDTRAHPAIAAGRFYARGKQRLVCVEFPTP
jgi:hypothetical protein